jgi:hypothetical protein
MAYVMSSDSGFAGLSHSTTYPFSVAERRPMVIMTRLYDEATDFWTGIHLYAKHQLHTASRLPVYASGICLQFASP